MISEANQKAIEAAGLSFILGMKIPDVRYVVGKWRREHSGEDIPNGHQAAAVGDCDRRSCGGHAFEESRSATC